jgi:hypothetical protein
MRSRAAPHRRNDQAETDRNFSYVPHKTSFSVRPLRFDRVRDFDGERGGINVIRAFRMASSCDLNNDPTLMLIGKTPRLDSGRDRLIKTFASFMPPPFGKDVATSWMRNESGGEPLNIWGHLIWGHLTGFHHLFRTYPQIVHDIQRVIC